MNIVHVNDADLPGRRFNGYDMHLSLNRMGHKAKQFVTSKMSDCDTVIPLRSPNETIISYAIAEIERTLGIDTLVNPAGHKIIDHPDFQNADIVHYHLIHNNLISVMNMPALTKIKPSVWTIHDPWAVTGGCIHPLSCDGWERECGECDGKDNPTLRIPPERTRDMLKLKREVFPKLQADIVVASEFSERLIRRSGIFGHDIRVHYIPFGIDVESYGKTSVEEARGALGIPMENFVIAFRAEKTPLKGCQFIFEALDRLDRNRLTVLTVGSGVVPRDILESAHVVQLGWTNNEKKLLDFYAACDIFLMPSLAESFGLMAIEAMAAGKPVVCFEGTALHDVTFAPECGVAVSYGNAAALAGAVERLRTDSGERIRRGILCGKIARERYDYNLYLSRHIKLYKEIYGRRLSG